MPYKSRQKDYHVYIMSNQWITVLYVGSTNHLIRRVWKHKHKYFNNSFTKKYNINRLLYYEKCLSKDEAIVREMQIKKWSRKKKINLIQTQNPEFRDLSEDWWFGRF